MNSRRRKLPGGRERLPPGSANVPMIGRGKGSPGRPHNLPYYHHVVRLAGTLEKMPDILAEHARLLALHDEAQPPSPGQLCSLELLRVMGEAQRAVSSLLLADAARRAADAPPEPRDEATGPGLILDDT